MPAFNFSAQFADAVDYGDKRQTIRAPRKDGRAHAKVGDTLALYTGMRTKSCRLLLRARCTRIDQVRIEATCMYLNGQVLFSAILDRDGPLTDNEFARADGFEGFTDMANWFRETHGLPFTGILICWQNDSAHARARMI